MKYQPAPAANRRTNYKQHATTGTTSEQRLDMDLDRKQGLNAHPEKVSQDEHPWNGNVHQESKEILHFVFLPGGHMLLLNIPRHDAVDGRLCPRRVAHPFHEVSPVGRLNFTAEVLVRLLRQSPQAVGSP